MAVGNVEFFRAIHRSSLPMTLPRVVQRLVEEKTVAKIRVRENSWFNPFDIIEIKPEEIANEESQIKLLNPNLIGEIAEAMSLYTWSLESMKDISSKRPCTLDHSDRDSESNLLA